MQITSLVLAIIFSLLPASRPQQPEPKVEEVIKSMLAEKGHQDATVETDTEDIPPNSVSVTFKVNEGPAVKVENITIEGNKAFTSREIKRAMKLVKEISPITVFTGKDT